MSMNFSSTTAKKRRSKYSSKSSSKKRRDENTPRPSESTLSEMSESSFSSDDDTDTQREPKGISSNAYEARSVTKQKFDGKEVERLVSRISMGKNADVPACYLFQGETPYGFDLTTFGEVPVGSPLNYQFLLSNLVTTYIVLSLNHLPVLAFMMFLSVRLITQLFLLIKYQISQTNSC